MNKLSLCTFVLLEHIGGWIPDKLYLRIQYFLYMGERLNLNNPQTFCDKIQYLKLYDRKEYYHKLVDKYEVKKIISSLIGNDYVIPTLGVWDSFDDIDFSTLPQQFVLKTTNASQTTMICMDKRSFDVDKVRKLFKRYLKISLYKNFREWVYKGVKPRIIAERYMELVEGEDLIDYKFYCFDGEPLYCQVIKNRRKEETIDFFDQDWNHQEFWGLRSKVTQSKVTIERPINYDKMLEIARKLSKGIAFLRVDLYNLHGKIYFGELTFYPSAGFGFFTPKEWNVKLGNLIRL